MRVRSTFLYAFSEKLLNNRRLILLIWFLFALYGAWQALSINQINNYLVYKHVFIHTINSTNLYLPYPAEYADVNLYGPFFSLVIAPFTCFPDKAGALLWVIVSALFLLIAILRLPIPDKWKNILLLLSAQELMITSASLQTNALVCACMMFGFIYTRKEKDFWALFFIMAAAFIKIYGIVGLVFFFLSRKKIVFLTGAIVWSIVFFFAPLVITHFNFLWQSYYDWYEGLRVKAAKNILPGKGILFQNVSVPGMLRRIFFPALNDELVLIPGFILFLSECFRFRYMKDIRYQLYLLCSVLITIVIFSTGAESSTYIIAVPGMVLWYLLQPKTRALNIFFATAFIITSFAYSDILTSWSRTHLFRPYSLKAFFPFVIWIIILIQIYTGQFLKAINPFTLMKLQPV